MKILVGLFLVLSGCAVAPCSFEAYSIRPLHIKENAKLRMPRSGLNWKMEEYLQISGQDGAPDFAARYTLFSIGCGTGCTEYAVIDRLSGEVYPGDTVTLDFPSDYHGRTGLQFRLDSRLLVIRRAEGFKWPVYVSYYVWEGATMKLLKKETRWTD